MKRRIGSAMRVIMMVVILTGFTSGCVCSIGGSKGKCCDVKQGVTIGQELIDLKKAMDQGALSEDEYNQKKEQILKNDK